MALTGSLFITTITPSLTESQSFDVTYPSDLEEGHPDYDKRGTTETIWESSSIAETTEHEGLYTIIGQLSIHNKNIPDGAVEISEEQKYHVDVFYRSYQSKEDRLNNYYNPFKEGILHVSNFQKDTQMTSSQDVIGFCYDYLKTFDEFSGSSDV